MFRFLRRLIGLAILVAVIVGGVWVYKTMTLTDPADQIWTTINSRLPQQARAWSCQSVKDRLKGTAKAPMGCEGVWR